MAECVAPSLCLKLRMQRRHVAERSFLSLPTSFKILQRKYTRNGCKFVHFSKLKMLELSDFGATNLEVSSHLQQTPLKCIGLGALVDFDGAMASGLVPVVDQMLLVASIFLMYMAGVIPDEKSYTSYPNIIYDKNVVSESSRSSGSAMKSNDRLNSKCALNVVRQKILNSLNALELEAYSGDCILDSAKRPLSLNAVAEGPKLRLLWAAFRQVEEEVNNVSCISGPVVMDNWFKMFSQAIQRSSHSICFTWLEKEIFLGKGKVDKGPASLILEKVKGDGTMVQNIKRSGKEDLYAGLLCYLTLGSLWEDCYYDSSLFDLHGISILEDFIIALADEAASMYLEFISVDGDVSSYTNSLDLSFCNLSTRELQRLRNEVALNQWLYHNVDTVVSMYEDRFDLRTLESQPIDLPGNTQTENQSWWMRFTLRKSKTTSRQLDCIVIGHFSLPVKRTKELRALTGWRYYLSLFLELSDISMPLIKAVIGKVRDTISFFLVCLIGRSVGLIYTGIRQSLRWK